MESFIKRSTGASEGFIFDHTVRKSSVPFAFNFGEEKATGPVSRVHCDYTDVSAPRRFKQLGQSESYTGFKVAPERVEELMKKRYSFINVWRSITDEPV